MTTYATLSEYRARMTSPDDDDTLLTAELEAASRLLDRELFAADGMFAPIASATYSFPGTGSSRLWLRDASEGYLLRSIVSVTIDGDPIEVADLTTHPLNTDQAVALARTSGVWPSGAVVAIAGAWGYETTPPPLRELVVSMTRRVRDAQQGGAAMVVNYLGEGVELGEGDWRLWASTRRAYSLGVAARK